MLKCLIRSSGTRSLPRTAQPIDVRDKNSLSLSPDGQRAATASLDKTVKVWDLSNGKEVLRIDCAPALPAVAGVDVPPL